MTTETVVSEQAFFNSAQSGAKELIFWQGMKSISPRPISIWVEPIVTIGAAGRLHSEFGWPRLQIGLQSKTNWAFDLVAYNHDCKPLIACEVKKSHREIDNLIEAMLAFISLPPLKEEPENQKLRNAYRKVVGLRSMKPKIFWALGPDNYGKIFRFVSSDNIVTPRLEEVDEAALTYWG